VPPPLRIESHAVAFAHGERARRSIRRFALPFFLLGALTVVVTDRLYAYAAMGYAFAFTLGALTLAGLFHAFSGALRGRAVAGSVEVEGGRLLVRRGQARHEIPLTALEQGFLTPPEGAALRLADGREIHVACDREAAEALLDHAGLGPAQCVARLHLASAASKRLAPLASAALSLCTLAAFLAGLALTMALGALALKLARWEAPTARYLLPFLVFGPSLLATWWGAARLERYLGRREAVIGTDGVAFAGRFHRHREIAAVSAYDRGVRLTMTDGGTIDLPVRGPNQAPLPDGPPAPGNDALDLELRASLLERLTAARAVREAALPSLALDALERGAQPFAAWIMRLRGLLAREPAYRAASVDEAGLRDLVADARVAPTQRIAAAVALSSSEVPEDRAHLRAAAQACADAELRAALEEAAAGEIDERRLARLRRGPHA
jgi:hypothetical protein